VTRPGGGRVFVAAIAACLLTAGCGEDEAGDGTLSGDRVARMAEAQLEATHPYLARGTMACADLEFRIGATTRCTRTGYLSRGRIVRVLGTVEVTRTANEGMLHVELDDEVRSFALAGTELATRIAGTSGTSGLTCGDLEGVVGARAVCADPTGAEILAVAVRVDRVTYDIEFELGRDARPGS
jgi:hypothetical protein